VLWKRLAKDHVAVPEDSDDWRLVAANFQHKWGFPHCLGSIDGKHVVLRAPGRSGSMFYNYKGTFSLVLLAVADANLKFLMVDAGSYGRNSDGGILSRSVMGRAIAKNSLNFPPPSLLDASHLGPLPYVFIEDEAFPLQNNLMRPFPGKQSTLSEREYNYRLSRARRTVENTFGVLAARWRVYHTKIATRPTVAKDIVKATIVLHDLLQRQTTPAEVTSLLREVWGARVQGLQHLQHSGTAPECKPLKYVRSSCTTLSKKGRLPGSVITCCAAASRFAYHTFSEN
jgi:hypothetical protein